MNPAITTPPRREIIVNGVRYYIGSNRATDPDHYKGFGGRKYTIRFHDGTLLKTDDLMWDYSHKVRSLADTAIILAGWMDRAPICGWTQAGQYQVFGPLR